MNDDIVIALRALRSIAMRDWQVEALEYLDRLDALLARVEPPIHRIHWCSGCGRRWDADFGTGAHLCGDCWRRGQSAVFATARLSVARVEPQEQPYWMPSASELLQHAPRYRALRAAVDALDPAAADDRPDGEWGAAKWAVFNAAVRLVKETAPDIGARVEPPPQEQEKSLMQFPDSSETRITEQLMAAIREHLKVEPQPQENHHYNRVYETVYGFLRRLNCTRCSSGTFELRAELPRAMHPSLPTQEPT